MRILVISNLYPPHHIGGYELHCQRMVNGLRALGHSVLVLTSDHGSAESEPQTRRRLRIHGMFGHPWLPFLHLRQMERHNNRVLRETLAEFKPDVVHGWNFSGLSKSLLLTLRRAGTPAAYCVCDHWIARAADADVWLKWWNQSHSPLRARLLRWALELTGVRRLWDAETPTASVKQIDLRRACFCSRALRDLTAAAGYEVENSQIIHCSADTARFNAPPKPIDAAMQRLVFVGRLHPDKGPMTALRAMSKLRDKYAGRLSIYGRGEPEYEAKLKNYVKQNDLPVSFHEAAPEEMPSVYAAHDALLFTSEWLEPFAITPLEAMASGLPVITTLTGGSAELFRHGENALTFPAADADELARQILTLDRDRLLRFRIATAGRQETLARCAEPIILRQTETYLRETIQLWA
jgi:glycosyltransferase involved in cell wall biosynthesis